MNITKLFCDDNFTDLPLEISNDLYEKLAGRLSYVKVGYEVGL